MSILVQYGIVKEVGKVLLYIEGPVSAVVDYMTYPVTEVQPYYHYTAYVDHFVFIG